MIGVRVCLLTFSPLVVSEITCTSRTSLDLAGHNPRTRFRWVRDALPLGIADNSAEFRVLLRLRDSKERIAAPQDGILSPTCCYSFSLGAYPTKIFEPFM